jgi:hypothetical protein
MVLPTGFYSSKLQLDIKVLAQQVVNQALNTPRVVVPSSSVHVWTVFDGDGAPGFTFAFDKGIVHVV